MTPTSAPLPYDYVIYAGIAGHAPPLLSVVHLHSSDLSWREMSLKTFHTRIIGLHYMQCPRPPDGHTATGRIWSHPDLTYNEVLADPEILCDYWPSDSATALDIRRDGNSLVSDHIPAFQPATPRDVALSFVVEVVESVTADKIHRIGQHLLSSLGPQQVLPSPNVSDIQQLLAQPGMLLVDKTHGVSIIDNCDPYSILILRRPRGFGMSTFLSMVSQLYDDLSSPALIDALYPMDEAYFLPVYPVLRLDLSKVSADASTIEQSLHDHVKSEIRQLWLKYDYIYGCQDVEEFLMPTPGDTLVVSTTPYVTPAHQTLLIVENYDSPVLRARPDDRAAVMRHMDEFIAAMVMSHVHGHFIRTILTSEILTGAYSGIIHLDRLEEYSHDLTHDAALQEAFGFTEKEVRALDGALEGNNPAAADVIQDLHERGIESFNFNTSSESTFEFSGSTDAVYSMQEVLDVLAQRIGKPNRQ